MKSFDPDTGAVGVTLANGKALFTRHDGKPADMSKPVQVFILLGQSNMVGLGKTTGGEGSLGNAVKAKSLYPYLVDDAGGWLERKDARFVRMIVEGELEPQMNTDGHRLSRGCMDRTNRSADMWMTIKGGTVGPEYGLGHPLANAIDAPVMILKSCIGNPRRGDQGQ